MGLLPIVMHGAAVCAAGYVIARHIALIDSSVLRTYDALRDMPFSLNQQAEVKLYRCVARRRRGGHLPSAITLDPEALIMDALLPT